MRILVAPLNWGLGHATRCIPLIRKWIEQGDEVVLAGDGDSLLRLRKEFPQLETILLPELNLRYSQGKSQVGAMLLAMPKIIVWAIKEHLYLRELVRYEKFNRIVSDNRFGLYLKGEKRPQTIYITHQLFIRLPRPWRWLEGIARRWHGRIIAHYDECWVPDYEGNNNLSGELSHRYPLPANAQFIGPLSRFQSVHYQPESRYTTIALLSGIEPQRTILENQIIEQYKEKNESLLIVRGLPREAQTKMQYGNLTRVASLTDQQLAPLLLGAQHIIARSGYSTLMDLHALGVLNKAELIPTPGQPEQEYLQQWITKQTNQCE